MPDFDFLVSSDEALLELDVKHLVPFTTLHIHNPEPNNASKIYVILPNAFSTSSLTSPLTHWYSTLNFSEGKEPELVILISAPTHFHSNAFKNFKHIHITDQKYQNNEGNENESRTFEPISNSFYNARLIIENFTTEEGFIFSNQLKLLGKGEVSKSLGINLHGNNTLLELIGEEYPNQLVIDKLDVTSDLERLLLDKVLLKKILTLKQVDSLSVKKTTAYSNWQFGKINDIDEFDLITAGKVTELFTDKAHITNINCPKGKFYISANSYIDFKVAKDQFLCGIELCIDMSASLLPNKKVIFSADRFNFDQITIINADSVSMPYDGTCRQLLLQNCEKVQIDGLHAAEIHYAINKPGIFICNNGDISNGIFMLGEVKAFFSKLKVKNIESYGCSSIELSNGTDCDSLKLNLNLDASNQGNKIKPNKCVIRVFNNDGAEVEVGLILAKLSTLYVTGKVKLGTVIVQSIDKLTTLFWVDMTPQTQVTFEKLFIFNDHDIKLHPNGTIEIIKNVAGRAASSGATYISASGQTSDFFHVSIKEGVRFHGKIISAGDIGMISKYADLFVSGYLKAANRLMLSAPYGAVSSLNSHLEAQSISIYSGSGTYLAETSVQAEEIISYSLSNYIQTKGSNLKAQNIVLVAEGENRIANSSEVNSQNLIIKSGTSTVIHDGQVVTDSLFMKSLKDFLFINSGIRLNEHPHVLFVKDLVSQGGSLNLLQCGLKVASDLTLIGVVAPGAKVNLTVDVKWQKINFQSDEKIENDKIYIEAGLGLIVGSHIDAAKMQVIIKTHHSLEMVPLVLYNEVMANGGLNTQSIELIASRINAGLIDIDAGKVGIFISSLLKCVTGTVSAEVLTVLLHPKDKIEKQQERIKILKDAWQVTMLPDLANMTIGEYFNFSQSTSITQRIGNLTAYDEFASHDLLFTKTEGDFVLGKSLTKYDKLYLHATNGKILIVSKNLQYVYRDHGGSEQGRDAAYDSRTVIGGNEVYLIADEVVSHAGKFEVTGTLKIVTKDGVYLLPVAVHERLMYYLGSKTNIDEYVVRQVISEINAGYLDIKAGGALEAVSALIKATKVNLDVKELKLRAEYDIFERHVHFVGSEKWYGGRQEWTDYTSHSLVQPTFIQAGNLTANVNGTTTIEAAQILVADESSVISTGNIHFLHKYDIHVHDHASSKSYLFNFHNGKLSVGGTKSVKEHFYGEAVVPTLYYSGGNFYGYSDGKIHLLGSKIIGSNIHLVGKQGVKLEVAPYIQEKIVSITQTGMRIGYNVGAGEASVCAEIFKNIDKLTKSKELYEATSIIASGTLIIESTDGALEVVSSQMKFAKAIVKVRGLHFSTHHETTLEEHVTTNMSAGLRAGMQETISGTLNTAGYLLDKSGTHWLDVLDRVLNVYKLGTDVKHIADDIKKLTASNSPQELAKNLKNLDTVKFGVWAAGKVTETSTSSHQSIALDNQFIGGDVDIQVDGDAVMTGIICHVDNFKLTAKSAKFSASHDSSSSEQATCEIEITIPISGSVSGGISGSDRASSSSNLHYHSSNMITVKGQLEITVEGGAKISGVRLLASKVLIRANDLVVESLQDVVQERMRGLELNASTNIAGNFQNIGGKAEVGSRDAKWSNAIGSIIGTQVVNIVVQQTLEIAGGLIANAEVNADGSLTDKGKMKVEAASIVARQLHDFDNGKTFGLGVALTKKVNSKGDIAYGTGMPVICSFNDSSRDIMPVIGRGDVILTQQSILPPDLNRNISDHIGNISSEHAALKANLPLSDIVEFIQGKLSSAAKGVSAGGDPESKEVEKELEEEKEDYAELPDLIDEDETNEQQEENNKASKDRPAKGIKSEQNDQPKAELNYSTIMTIVKPSDSQTLKLNQGTIDYLTHFFESDSQTETSGLSGTQAKHSPSKDDIQMWQAIAAGGADGIYFDPYAQKFIKDNPKTAIVSILAAPIAGFMLSEYLLGAGSISALEGTIGSSFLSARAAQLSNYSYNLFTGSINAVEQVTARIVTSVALAPNLQPLLGLGILGGIANSINDTSEDWQNLFGQNDTSQVEHRPNNAASKKVPIWSLKPSATNYNVTNVVNGVINNDRILANISPYIVIDPDANKPQIIVTIPPDFKPSHNITEDDRDKIRELKKPIGFEPHVKNLDNLREGFDIHETKLEDFILFNEGSFDPSKEGNFDKVSRDSRFGKIYRDAENNKLWYSKEISGERAHGGEHWKQFKDQGKFLVHEADIDMTGKVMDKHKSTIGTRIKIKDLIGIK